MSRSHRDLAAAAARGVVLIACLVMLGCGSSDRLQVTTISPTRSVIPTVDPRTRAPGQNPTLVPTVDPRTRAPGQNPTLVPTVDPRTRVPDPPPSESTPNYRGTTIAVFQTVTAQYFTATPPPTLIPTRRVPVGAGPQAAPPTATPIDATAGTAIVTVVERVAPGGAAVLSVRTMPGAVCSVASMGDAEAWLPLPGAPARAANGDGSVAWLWTVDPQAPVGALTIGVDCGDAGAARAIIRVER